MAKCKICKTNIPDGEEYCKDCLEKMDTKANESYLDSLLTSVKESAPTADTVYRKKNNKGAKESYDDQDTEDASGLLDDEILKFDLDDIEDFDQFDINADLEDLQDGSSISDEDLFGEALSDIFSDKDTNETDNIGTDMFRNDTTDSFGIQSDNNKSKDKINDTNLPEEGNSSNSMESVEENIAQDNINTNEIDDFSDEDTFDTDLNNLLNQLDEEQTNPSVSNTDYNDNELYNNEGADEINDNKQIVLEPDHLAGEESHDEVENNIEDDDFLSMLNQIDDDDPVADDVKAISDLMSGLSMEPSLETNIPGDVGEVFSDALKGISNLNDPNVNEADLLNQIPGKKEKKKKEKKVKEKKAKKKKAEKGPNAQESEEKAKVGFFKRIFGNVEDKNASKREKQQINQDGLEYSDGLMKLEPDKAKKEKPKKAKKNKAASAKDGDTDNESANNKKAKKAKKKSNKEKKPKSTDVIQVIDEIEEDTGRINRVGAAVVFVFFGLLALTIYTGSNAVSYTLSIQHATSYFNDQKYTQAYDEVYGMKIDDEDVEIYSKIMTVMFVNKQLNSYNNYCSYKDYPRALDSLLKGLKRYDKYIELATMLGIKNDMNYVRKQIIAELNNKFSLSEKDALRIMNLSNKREYSSKVYDVVQANELL